MCINVMADLAKWLLGSAKVIDDRRTGERMRNYALVGVQLQTFF